jgi:hypothetical protein
MMGAEISVLLGVVMVVSLGLLAHMARVAWPVFRAVREELASTPLTREMRFTITETVVSWNDGTVVALPVRQVRLVRPALAPALLSEAA